MRLELSRLPVLSLFNEKQGILLRENIIPCHNLGPLPLSRNCHAIIQLNVGQAGAHIWYPHVHFHSLYYKAKRGYAQDLTVQTRPLNTINSNRHSTCGQDKHIQRLQCIFIFIGYLKARNSALLNNLNAI